MNVHERIIKTLEHEEPDRIPTLAQVLENGFMEKLDDIPDFFPWLDENFSGGNQYMLDCARYIGLDAIWYHYHRQRDEEKDKPEVPKDILEKYELGEPSTGGHYSEKGWYKDGVLKTPELLKEWTSYIKTWEAGEEKNYIEYSEIWEENISKGLVPIPTGGGVAYVTWSSIGINRFAYLARKHLNLIKDLAMAWGKFTMKQHDLLFEHGVDMVFICDDFCMKERSIYSPKQFDEIVVPVYTMLSNNAHKKGGKFLIHSDGNVSELLPLLVKAKVDAIEPLEYESGARIPPLKEQFGDNITFIGNVPATFTLSFGTVEETVRKTKDLMLQCGEGGGYIVAAGSDVLASCKVENMRAMIATAKKFGTYPLNKDKLRA
ncbi:MAG: uroporphyrinogen decarboxylase family protein [Candidatus Hodarchaeota archaeon]